MPSFEVTRTVLRRISEVWTIDAENAEDAEEYCENGHLEYENNEGIEEISDVEVKMN